MLRNERKTERLVRKALDANGFDEALGVFVEEQKSEISAVKRLLRAASKAGKGGGGAPEFIISCPAEPDVLLLIECKADPKFHISARCQDLLTGTGVALEDAAKKQARTVAYAADGVLHYAQALSREFTVLAVAASGEDAASFRISTFIHARGANSPKLLLTKAGQEINSIIPWPDLIEHATFDPSIRKMRFEELMAFSRELHDFMRDHAKLTESEKPLLVSGTLLALQDPAFSKSFGDYKPEELPTEWIRMLSKVLVAAKIQDFKVDNVTQPYSSIAVHPELGKATKVYPRGVLFELIKMLSEKVAPFIVQYHDFDVVGQFYGEFLKYTGGDKKALGIVLTPRHVVELFSLIANVGKDSKVLDICAGTGGFLIGAMHRMMRQAVTKDDEDRIRSLGLVGAEQLPNMYALAASNMILRGDGKANLYRGSCFEPKIVEALKSKKCDVGMINPPYSQKDNDQHELVFVRQMLDLLEPGATGVAIVPMGCAIAPHPEKAKLLKQHTLEAVMSMPDELFYPVGTVTCIMVLTAHRSHAKSDRSTWFGYWKYDGFVKTKNKGRIDLNSKWALIRDSWIEAFRNRNDVPGFSVKKKITADEEWCAEAYMETDYARVLTKDAFELEVRKHLQFELMNEAEERALKLLGSDGDDSDEAIVA